MKLSYMPNSGNCCLFNFDFLTLANLPAYKLIFFIRTKDLQIRLIGKFVRTNVSYILKDEKSFLKLTVGSGLPAGGSHMMVKLCPSVTV